MFIALEKFIFVPIVSLKTILQYQSYIATIAIYAP